MKRIKASEAQDHANYGCAVYGGRTPERAVVGYLLDGTIVEWRKNVNTGNVSWWKK